MSRKGRSFFIESTGPQDAAIIQGFEWLVSQAKQSGNKAMVAVAQKVILDNIANWSQRASLLKQLRQHGTATVGEVTIELFTARDAHLYKWDGPILAIYGGQKLLDAVDAIPGTASVLYVPWVQGDCSDWAATWGAIEIGQPDTNVAEQGEPTSGAVYVALQSLTQSVNLNTGIGHSSDYEQAVRTLETLFHKGAAVVPETIRRQLVRLGWNPQDAAKVRELAEKIWDGRRPKKSTGRADESLWDYWNNKAN